MRKIVKFISLVAIIMISIVLYGQNGNFSPKKLNTSYPGTVTKEMSPDTKKITFNFPNTQLNVFASFVAKLCGKVLIGESLLTGNINIKSQTNLSLNEVRGLFETILNSKGLDFTENNIFIEIIPISNSTVEVYKINYLKAADIAKSLSQMFRMSFNVGNQPTSIQITSIDDANSLMVLAPKGIQVEIEKSIKKMDVRVRQVMLNVMILEVSKISQFGFGMDVIFKDGGTITGLTSGSGGGTDPMTFTTSNTASAGGVTYSKGNWSIDIQGVDKNTYLKILQQPKVLAADNQKAEIKLGKKQPFITSTVNIGSSNPGGDTPSGGDSSTSSSISTEDVGIDIEITPRINNLQDVTLDLKLKITSITNQLPVLSNGTSNDIPQVGHRIINNSSNVSNGEVLVLGGLLKNQKTIISTAPPIVGKIPWVGWMFAKESEATEQIELMVFISPTVILDSEEAAELTKKETNTMRNYDLKTKGTIDQMLTKKKTLNDDVFNMFDYFNSGKYRSEQDFISQPRTL